MLFSFEDFPSQPGAFPADLDPAPEPILGKSARNVNESGEFCF
jgi:hypothetical protein